jgi:hypothetical protein
MYTNAIKNIIEELKKADEIARQDEAQTVEQIYEILGNVEANISALNRVSDWLKSAGYNGNKLHHGNISNMPEIDNQEIKPMYIVDFVAPSDDLSK